MRTDTGTVTRCGDRENNQDRVAIESDDLATLLVVADGMGGHRDGAGAAQSAVDAVRDAFAARGDTGPAAFLVAALQRAHAATLALGDGQPIDERPRTTGVAALVADGQAWWAHVGDSRAYLLRDGVVAERTRDHSHVESLRSAGEIDEAEMLKHPLRNLVERCIGGEAEPVEVEVAGPFALAGGDILLLCSDGFWDGLDTAAAAGVLLAAGSLDESLRRLADDACAAHAPYADNATAAALRVLA